MKVVPCPEASSVCLLQGEERLDMEKPNPFVQEDEEGEVASVCYKYVLVTYLQLYMLNNCSSTEIYNSICLTVHKYRYTPFMLNNCTSIQMYNSICLTTVH